MAGDQRDYWNQFIATVSWDEPKELVGTIEALDSMEGMPPGRGLPRPRYPVLRIRLESGRGVIVNGAQARLLELLTDLGPEVGDRIKIVYKGEADKAAPGMSPTKEFEVKIQKRPPTAAGQ